MKTKYFLLSLLLGLFLCRCATPQYRAIKTPRTNVFFLVEKSISTDNKKTREYVKKAIGQITDSLLQPGSRIKISIATFGDTFSLVRPLTTIKDSVFETLYQISENKNSSPFAYLDPALDSLEDVIINDWVDNPEDDSTVVPAIIVILSDGFVEDTKTAAVRANVIKASEFIQIVTMKTAVETMAAPEYLLGLANSPSDYYEQHPEFFAVKIIQAEKQ